MNALLSAIEFLIPYRRLVIASTATTAEVEERLGAAVEGRWAIPSDSDVGYRPFRGRVGGGRFRLDFNDPGVMMNTYAPWIRGSILETGGGAELRVRMSPHPVGYGIISAFALAAPLVGGSVGMTVALWSAFHVALGSFGFWPAARRAERALSDVVR